MSSRCASHSDPHRSLPSTPLRLPALPRLALTLAFLLALPALAVALPPPDPQTGKGPWQPVRQSHGVTVHRRAVAGSNLHEFRGVAVIEAPIATVLAVLDDAEHRLEWMKEARANTRIRQVDDFTEVFYSRTAAPWPVADRDVVLQSRTTFDADARQVRIDIESTSDPAWPEQKGVVRMPFLRGHWYLWPEHDGAWTRAEYQVHANPAGMLTDFLINQVSKTLPYDTLLNMQKQVTRRSYPQFEKRLATLPAYQTIVRPTATAPPTPASGPPPSPPPVGGSPVPPSPPAT